MDPTPAPQPEFNGPSIFMTCPFCQAQMSVPPSEAGATVDCPQCNGKFQVPLPTARVATAGGPHYVSAASPEAQAFASKKIAAGICGILLGGFGVHKFVLGFNGAGIIMLSVWMVGMLGGMCLVFPILGSMAMGIIGLVEGIIYLTKSDEEFYQTYSVQKKEWF